MARMIRKAKPDDEVRRLHFEACVLQGIWKIIKNQERSGGFRFSASDWRVGALDFLDTYGIPGNDAKKFRRERVFPE